MHTQKKTLVSISNAHCDINRKNYIYATAVLILPKTMLTLVMMLVMYCDCDINVFNKHRPHHKNTMLINFTSTSSVGIIKQGLQGSQQKERHSAAFLAQTKMHAVQNKERHKRNASLDAHAHKRAQNTSAVGLLSRRVWRLAREFRTRLEAKGNRQSDKSCVFCHSFSTKSVKNNAQ